MVETEVRNDAGPFAKAFSCGLTNVMLFTRPMKAPKKLQPHNGSFQKWPHSLILFPLRDGVHDPCPWIWMGIWLLWSIAYSESDVMWLLTLCEKWQCSFHVESLTLGSSWDFLSQVRSSSNLRLLCWEEARPHGEVMWRHFNQYTWFSSPPSPGASHASDWTDSNS